MSERDEADDKITVLFPDREDEGPEDPEGEPVGEDSEKPSEDGDGATDCEGEAPVEESPESQQQQQDQQEADNVVRLDFENQTEDDSSGGDGPVEALQPMEASEVQEAKYEVFCRMIEEGMVMVTLDTRADGVEVPPKFEGLPELRLNFSHLFHIDDFDYDPDGVRASLSFDGSRHFCNVPWESVFMLYSHESGDVVVFEPSGELD